VNIGNPFLTFPILLVRCDTAMNVIWARYASNVRDPDKNFIPVAIDSNDAVYVGVQVNYQMIIGSDTIGAQGTIFTGEGGVIKIDASGNDVWARALTSSITCYAWSMCNTSDNSGIMLGGGYAGIPTLGTLTLPAASTFGLPFIAKINSDGNFTKLFRYLQNPTQTDAQCLLANGDGKYFVGGQLPTPTVPVFSCTPVAPASGFYLGLFTEQPDSVPTPVIIANGTLLTATPAFSGNVQWFFNGSPIAGENGPTHTATQEGNYTVSYTYTTGCTGTKTSAPVFVSFTSSGDYMIEQMHVFPNPASKYVSIRNIPTGSVIKITDLTGKMLLTDVADDDLETISIADLPNGLFILHIENSGSITTAKLVISR
jgi:hypothetical protein